MSEQAQTNTDYEELPYRSVPFGVTEPARLAALGTLFGLEPAAPSQARVLELGCASGGNILPLAMRYPEARFTGIDLSDRHIRDGQAKLEALGLENVDLTRQDIAELDLAGQQFDYIICHGVYSWVPGPAQDAILRLAGDHLAENGIAYVSYNIYPGWHMRSVVRDLCLYHAGTEGDAKLRVAKARWMLEQLAGQTNEATPFGQLLRNEAKSNAKAADSYILGEFLAPHNSPCFFHEFTARADGHGLSYLTDSELEAAIPENLPAETARLIRSIAGTSGMAIEQYMDFFGGRQFRRSLLVRKDQAARVSRRLGPERLKGLHLASPFHKQGQTGAGTVYTAAAGSMTVTDPQVQGILDMLEAAWPGTRTPDEIASDLSGMPGGAEPVLTTLFKLAATGKLELRAEPRICGGLDAERPRLWPIARYEAEQGQSWLSSQLHEPVTVDATMIRIAPALDGTRTRQDLHEIVRGLLYSGEARIKGGGDGASADNFDEAAARYVEAALDALVRSGLLCGQ